MKRVLTFRGVIGSFALILASPLAAEEAPQWRDVDASTGQIRDIEGLEALAADFPDSGSVRLRMLQPLLAAGEIEKLLETLAWLKERGYVFGEVSRRQIPKLVGEEHADAARALLLPEAEVIEASELVATVPAEAGLVESVFALPGPKALIATSVTSNSVHMTFDGTKWDFIPIPEASDLSGIVGEDDDSIGWVASANIDGSDDEEPFFTGLMGLRGDFQNPIRVPAPEGVLVSDLTIGRDATVYASDPQGGGIYRKPMGATELETLIAPGTFRSPQGLAVSKDGKRLYVSDYRYGLAFIDLASGEVSRLRANVPAILDGIDGLWLHRGELIAMQNGTSPMRISAFRLSEDGDRVIAARVLEQAHSQWTEPLGGSVSEGSLTYVATGQWDRFVQGESAQDKPAIPTQIRRLPLQPRGD